MGAFPSPSSLVVSLLMTILTSSVRVAESCTPCFDYFEGLQNRTQGSCRCIFNEFYSKDHPQMIADCNNLEKVPDFDAICNMTDVYSIDLQGNRIKKIDQFAFRALKVSDAVLSWSAAKPELILYRNQIESIHMDAFKGGLESKLSHLNLKYNKLQAISQAIFTLVNLTDLHLGHNLIDSIQGHGEERLRKLGLLDLGFNKLTVFPSSVCNFPSLRTLYLDGNPIEEDLSSYLDDLSKCNQLRVLSWPSGTATCNKLAIETYANTTSCKVMKVRHGYKHVTCDSDSSPEYRGIGFEWALRKELSVVCPDISVASQVETHCFALIAAIMLVTWNLWCRFL